MNEIDFYNLRVCWSDFLNVISNINIERITEPNNKNEWIKLRTSFTYDSMRRYTQDEIVTKEMATILHKYIAIACTSHFVPQIELSCPGWPWLLMEMDAQVAKRKGIHLRDEALLPPVPLVRGISTLLCQMKQL